jgi:hypothetical protein
MIAVPTRFMGICNDPSTTGTVCLGELIRVSTVRCTSRFPLISRRDGRTVIMDVFIPPDGLGRLLLPTVSVWMWSA